MKLLLDTHAFMWWHSDPECIPKSTIHLLQDPDNEVIISVVSLWEMQIKIQLGKLALRDDLELMLKIQRERNNIRLISATLPHILELKTLPLHHKDPFDRMLIAQSKIENATLVSRDSVFKSYKCSVIW
ncbi:type II toxin-antitoxin system VapC family toxin [Dolichospermum sp. LEGE 00240]|jgi:PIN domain nuclease of toxin-antitoxin system|uniref:type II toxin-antitoxin system VapC family toxin n=1 Tax=Dolichospermum sp. LEGE 00240 TaxID=1828603 RepID=UPI00187FD27D|nr:type II toxin-antitoxin system VapC family toxin [Dolichospermum sp. LEGE 00240]MDM3848009.1 type II toxin-antitoxin system VapC family toxin [Aphanizomenon gracile PMC638.10]MDM3853025.1 type II toxin-antitoxin system VapC family toxin [Aphanizomenon gracile PMC627.10]MDM3853643.1 type II toxin-antitoxin system VapC family toxin [Aphanizomenon gracile PMC649.10]MDM3862717.1 type II toxin-antitoxin system VapC family toxin [Aphanizomenon gracile PMC644.10]MBE9250661.1 type II toxin-antitoxi